MRSLGLGLYQFGIELDALISLQAHGLFGKAVIHHRIDDRIRGSLRESCQTQGGNKNDSHNSSEIRREGEYLIRLHEFDTDLLAGIRTSSVRSGGLAVQEPGVGRSVEGEMIQ